MPRRLIVIGPLPPQNGQYWCAVCVANWKAKLVEVLKIDAEWIRRELDGDETSSPKVIAPPKNATMPPLEYGVTLMPVGAVGGAALTCWTHADATGTVPVVAAPGDGAQRLIPGLS